MGMGNIFNPENSFFTFMGKAFDILVLNLVWLALYIPFGGFLYLFGATGVFVFLILAVLSLVVFVPSMIAMYYAVVKSVRRSRSYAVREFFKSFKMNFKQGAVASGIAVLAVWLLYMDFTYSWALVQAKEPKGTALLGVFLMITFFISGVFIYLCPVISRFTMSLSSAFKFAFGISVKHIWCTILSFLMWVAIILLIYLTTGFVLLFGIATGTLLGSFMMEKVLKKYVLQTIENQKKAAEEAGENGETGEDDSTNAAEKPEYMDSFEDGGENSKKDEWYLE